MKKKTTKSVASIGEKSYGKKVTIKLKKFILNLDIVRLKSQKQKKIMLVILQLKILKKLFKEKNQAKKQLKK